MPALSGRKAGMKRVRTICVAAALVASLAYPLLSAQPGAADPVVPSDLRAELVASGLSLPTTIQFLPDGRLLIAEKPGVIKVLKNGVVLGAPMLDISSRVNDFCGPRARRRRGRSSVRAERLDLRLVLVRARRLDPQGLKNSRLSSFHVTGDVADPLSETPILGSRVDVPCDTLPAGADCIPGDWYGHQGGGIAFAADGTLFVSLGDGASWDYVDDRALRAQNLDSAAGKVLHITKTGQGVSGNPFWTGNPNEIRSKVWAFGFRNPFRLTLQPGTGAVVVGDVGWNDYEELDVISPGKDYGWPCYEGPFQQPGYAGKSTCQQLYAQGSQAVANPAMYYGHNSGGSAIVGGIFYTGTNYPAAYQGQYFFGDYARDFIHRIPITGSVAGTETPFATATEAPVSFAQGPDGNIYYAAIITGKVWRFVPSSSPPPPPPPPPPGTQYVSDLQFVSSSNGWGPVERDMSNGEAGAGDGNALDIAGTTYPKGLGVHADSDVTINLGANCTTFSAQVGVDSEVGGGGTVAFQVFVDGVNRFDSGIRRGGQAAVPVNVSLTGGSELLLSVTNVGDGYGNDHADWADARIVCGTVGTPPTATIASPSASTVVRVGDVIARCKARQRSRMARRSRPPTCTGT